MTKKERESWQTIVLGIGMLIFWWMTLDHDVYTWILLAIIAAAVLYNVRAIVRIRRGASKEN